jgi:hypothetical protein
MGSDVAVDLEQELVTERRCMACGWSDATIRPMTALGRGDGECPDCQSILTVQAGQSFAVAHPVAAVTLRELGLPARDVVTIRSATGRRHYLLKES